MSKKILILGAGYEQYPVLQRAKERGYHVIAVDNNPNAYGLFWADEFYQISTRDTNKILELAISKEVDAITSIISETPLWSLKKVTDQLNLPTPSLKSIEVTMSKGRMREFFQQKGIPNPRFAFIRDIKEVCIKAKEVGFPMVVKPDDVSGQRGVFKAENENQLLSVIERAMADSISGEVLIEEYMDGEEINVVALVLAGEIRAITMSDRLKDKEKAFGIVQRHLYPCQYSNEVQENIKCLVEKVVKELEIVNGVFYPQIIVTKEGPKVIEVGARIPGGMMKELFEHVTGYDLLDIQLDISLGKEIILEKYKKYVSNFAVTVKFLSADPGSLPTGEVQSYRGLEDVLKLPGVVKADFFQDPRKMIIKPLKTGGDRFFYIIVVGKTREEVIERSNKAAEHIFFDVK